MFKFLIWAKLFFYTPVQTTIMLYAKCDVITIPLDPDTVAVKWVCPN